MNTCRPSPYPRPCMHHTQKNSDLSHTCRQKTARPSLGLHPTLPPPTKRSSGDSRGRWASARRSNNSPGSAASGAGAGPADTFPNSPSISPERDEHESEDPFGVDHFLPGLPAADPIVTNAAAAGIGTGAGAGSPACAWVDRDRGGSSPAGSRLSFSSRDERGSGSSLGGRKPKHLPGECLVREMLYAERCAVARTWSVCFLEG